MLDLSLLISISVDNLQILLLSKLLFFSSCIAETKDTVNADDEPRPVPPGISEKEEISKLFNL